ncbi:MAG: hypothetical protein FD168_989 [Desulfobulbaceae bacterium]|jgi:hypothetical protein|nr:MAG: hypothetical protein FD168_989 [Desulfobulbaceae bacterium]
MSFLAKITLFCYIYFNFGENILHFCNCILKTLDRSLFHAPLVDLCYSLLDQRGLIASVCFSAHQGSP